MGDIATMHVTLEGGTDAGGMALFDPIALPADFDAAYRDDSLGQLESLMRVGRLYWINTHADGSYTLSIYQDPTLPETLQPYATALATVDTFAIPSRCLFF